MSEKISEIHKRIEEACCLIDGMEETLSMVLRDAPPNPVQADPSERKREVPETAMMGRLIELDTPLDDLFQKIRNLRSRVDL